MKGIGPAVGTAINVVLLAGAVAATEVAWLAPYLMLVPMPEPLRQTIEGLAQTQIFWALLALIVGGNLIYRTYKTFSVFSGLEQIRREADAGASQREELDQRWRASEARQRDYEETVRSAHAGLIETFYLTMAARPNLERKLEDARSKLARASGGENLGHESYRDAEASSGDPVDTAMTRRAGLVDHPVFEGRPHDDNLVPTKEAAEHFYATRVRQYEAWLNWIDHQADNFAQIAHEWVRDIG